MKVGILGGGQLARMLALAGIPLGIQFRIFSDRHDEATSDFADVHCGSYDDKAALMKFAQGLDLITFEFENLSTSGISALEEHVALYPSLRALATGQDREQEKALFRTLGIPTTNYVIVRNQSELTMAAAMKTGPGVVKTTRLGYDGKGQLVLRADTSSEQLRALGSGPFIIEDFVPFDREFSIIGVRSRSGEIRTYPLTENIHREGILRRSAAPSTAPNVAALEQKAIEYFRRIVEGLDYCGVLAVEFFASNGELIANEIAPRVHNTGHWTIEGAVTSKFENHLRAITGLPLGDTRARGSAVMINLIGELPPLKAVLSEPGAAVHLYGKSPRAGRKLGHITFSGSDTEELLGRSEAHFPPPLFVAAP